MSYESAMWLEEPRGHKAKVRDGRSNGELELKGARSWTTPLLAASFSSTGVSAPEHARICLESARQSQCRIPPFAVSLARLQALPPPRQEVPTTIQRPSQMGSSQIPQISET